VPLRLGAMELGALEYFQHSCNLSKLFWMEQVRMEPLEKKIDKMRV